MTNAEHLHVNRIRIACKYELLHQNTEVNFAVSNSTL